MGLLNRAIAISNSGANTVPKNIQSENVQSLIADFHRKNHLFHCIVFKGSARPIANMTAVHDAVCVDLSDENCLLLLPGGLDRELFTHRISRSAGSEALLQTTVNSASLALTTLYPYLY